MSIRNATLLDAASITDLLEQLGYPAAECFVTNKLERLLGDNRMAFVVWEEKARLLAFMTYHFVPQVSLEGDFAIMSYFSVDHSAQGQGIGREMEAYLTEMDKSTGCYHIQFHGDLRREGTYGFYERQGYTESGRYCSNPQLEEH